MVDDWGDQREIRPSTQSCILPMQLSGLCVCFPELLSKPELDDREGAQTTHRELERGELIIGLRPRNPRPRRSPTMSRGKRVW